MIELLIFDTIIHQELTYVINFNRINNEVDIPVIVQVHMSKAIIELTSTLSISGSSIVNSIIFKMNTRSTMIDH